MKRLAILGVALITCMSMFGQSEVPKFETYLGYSFTRWNSAINVPAVSANGGAAEFSFNVTHDFSLIASLNAVHNGNVSGFHIDSTGLGYMFGPRINLRHERWTPFAEVLFGATSLYRSFNATNAGLVTTTTSPISGLDLQTRFANTGRAFSMLAGGGIDINLNKHVAFRPIKLDYYLTRFQPLFISGLGNANRNRNQNNLIYGTGFNFRF